MLKTHFCGELSLNDVDRTVELEVGFSDAATTAA
jgi:hypothetical protein